MNINAFLEDRIDDKIRYAKDPAPVILQATGYIDGKPDLLLEGDWNSATFQLEVSRLVRSYEHVIIVKIQPRKLT